MATKSVNSNYHAVSRDRVENFGGNQLVFVAWDKHLFFAAPFSFVIAPEATFAQLFNDVISPAFAIHPCWSEVSLDKVQWLLKGESFQPKVDVSLSAQGVDHKSLLRMQTPDVKGFKGLAI